MDLLALVLTGVLESKTGDARRSFLGNDLQALHNSGNDFVFYAGVQPLGVFSNNNEIDVGIARRYMGQVTDRPEVGIQFESLAQLDINAGEAPANGSGHGAFQGYMRSLDRVDQFFRNVLVIFLVGLSARLVAFPFEFDSGRFQNANRGSSNLGPDTVPRYESDAMGHKSELPQTTQRRSNAMTCKITLSFSLLWRAGRGLLLSSTGL